MGRRAMSVVMGLVAVLATAACGGGAGSGDGVATAGGDPALRSASQKTDPQQAGLDFAECMREHGVDMEDPAPGQPGTFAIKVEGGPGQGVASGTASFGAGDQVFSADAEAFEACKHILDDAIGSGDVRIDPEMQDRALKFAQCMREHGVDMPDPQFSGGGVKVEIKGNLDPNSPTLQAAHEACGQHFGPPGGEGKPGAGFITSAASAKAGGS